MNELYKQTGNWWDLEPCPSRGFTKEEKKEYDQVLGYCHKINIDDDEEYKTRIVKLIDNIIHNDRFDIVSKLDKLYELISLNKSLRDYHNYIKTEYRENIQKENSLVNTTNE